MEEKFNQAQKMEAIGTLVGGIAHDFNNMLAGMIGSMYMMKSKLQQHPDVLRELESLETQSFRAADMIKQLLAFARKGNIEFKLLSFTSLMKEVFKLTSMTIPENISVQLNVCNEALEIKGDASLLQQILMNLMNNARDALADITQPSIDVIVDAYISDAAFVAQHPQARVDYPYARMRVHDNGCGIPKQDLDKIFEPYYTTKEVGKGTGLGLAMIFGSVQSHAGIIEVDSQIGQGTSVSIYLPLESGQDSSDSNVVAEGIIQGKGETILLVDDEDSFRTIHAELLTGMGYQILLAEDGAQALGIFNKRQHDIALLLTDVVMPVMGGIDLANALWKQAPTMPVIFLTGYDKNHLAKLSPDNKCSRILLKPFTIQSLSQQIHSLLNPDDSAP